MKNSSKTIFTISLLLGFAANLHALPEGVTCTGSHSKGNGICYDGCSKNGSAISGNYGVDGLWHDGNCATILKKPSTSKGAAIRDKAMPDKNVVAPAQ